MGKFDITVVIPVFNAEGTIERALDSILNQTYVPGQIVIVDDCSDDNTADMINRWCRKVNNIEVFYERLKENSGPSVARNKAVQMAGASWIAFLDADDMWLPYKLELQCDVLCKNPSAVFVAGLSSTSGITSDFVGGYSVTEIHHENFIDGNPCVTSTVLVRKDVLLKAGGFDPRFRGPEDYHLWPRLLKYGKLLRINFPLVIRFESLSGLSCNADIFFPQVKIVVNELFSKGGPLEKYRYLKRKALASQYVSVSWMRFLKGRRIRAIIDLCISIILWPVPFSREGKSSRLKLFIRYIMSSKRRDYES